MQQNLYRVAEVHLSPARLDAYRKRLPLAGELEVLTYYYWNVALSRALYAPLEAVEVGLRNRLHAALTDRFGVDRWFEKGSGPDLTEWHKREVTRVLDRLERRDRRALRMATPPPPAAGRVVAELNFGFWVGLFNKDYAEQQSALWRGDLIIKVFPSIPEDQPSTRRNRQRYRARKELSNQLNRILDLRNRVFHHEPIWYWKAPPIRNLGEQYHEMVEILRWMDPTYQKLVVAMDNFPEVYGEGPQPYRGMLNSLLSALET